MFLNQKKVFLLPFFLFLLIPSCSEEKLALPPDISVRYSVTDASTFNAKDGAIDVTVTGGIPPFQYFWSDGSTSEDLNGLYAGTYSLAITYGGKGIGKYDIKVGQPEPDPLQISVTVVPVSRYGAKDGGATLSISGGTPPYKAVWNGKDSVMNISGVPAGTYKLEVLDSGSPFKITGSRNVQIPQPEFICGTDSIRDVDGYLYPTVEIDDLCWMAANLRTERLPTDTTKYIAERFCNGLNCFGAKGAHYSWNAIMNGAEAATGEYDEIMGICPEGWHIPTRKNYQDLDAWLSIDGNGGPGTFSGIKMKGEESTSGFDALITGNWGYGIYSNTNIAAFWTSTQRADTPANAFYFMVTADTPLLFSGHKPKNFGFNLRCVKKIGDE